VFIDDNVVSKIPSPPAALKNKGEKGKKKFKYYLFVCLFFVYKSLFIVFINKSF
jgi:hypothetical protein